jgi:RNA polymerase sigma-70 factor (ECF subfamily)
VRIETPVDGAGTIVPPAMLISEESVTRPSDVAVLTAQMVKGDEDAYRQFYAAYFNRLLRYLLVITGGDEQSARDALQSAFLRVVRYIKRFESEDVLWSWLTVLARCAVIDEQRKEKRFQVLRRDCFQRQPPPEPGTARDVDGQLIGLLHARLEALETADRDLVERKYFAKQSVRELAAALDTTEKAVESRLVRVRRRLKELILMDLKHEI